MIRMFSGILFIKEKDERKRLSFAKIVSNGSSKQKNEVNVAPPSTHSDIPQLRQPTQKTISYNFASKSR